MAIVELSGVELAKHLATALSDLEFEMLIRERIKAHFTATHSYLPNLSDTHDRCSFRMSWNDDAEWTVGIGETYSRNTDATGQVLSNTMNAAETAHSQRSVNKLSRLLPSPVAPISEEF